ncbi:adhesion G protein-coupled receptor F5-like [Kryptolebias marmoratus]|uniref:adhesion G protein-coupled receptor F5-like n=1 Tax=Kryptolebias marmoratus TaxID=37003 RepID=UPI000D52FF58|nr:adhesion G protein-coupled receptor F5-like [Kryptolebias marmoratus]
MKDHSYGDIQDNCVLKVVHQLLTQSEFLNDLILPRFSEALKNATEEKSNEVLESPANINSIVNVFKNIANRSSSLNFTISENSTRNILETAGILTSANAKKSWDTLNKNSNKKGKTSNGEVKSASSSLLNSFEIISTHLANGSFSIRTPYILLNKTTLTNTFSGDFNSSVKINIPKTNEANISITVITFASMDNVLPARDEANSSADVINGRVALIQPEADIKNVSITFKTTTETLVNPKCVFWNFTLFDGLGGWSSEGCSLLFNENETVSCNCNHTTSFSILMSPESPDEPLLNSITYIGVGISMGSLVICLFTEAILWKRIVKNTTSYLRHVAIVNIAVSLLVANIWFFIGAAMSDDEKKIPLLKIPSCIVATFFIHFFYLALFFWMLALALLLLYRLVILFHGGLSERSMLAIGFSLGYGGPLIIATTTIAVTAPSDEYIQEPAVCWLNWNESQALLAFLIPALLIVVINLIIVFLVINKMLTRKVGENAPQERERHVMKVVSRTLIILTPFFGLTWILGVGTMFFPKTREIHIAFAFSNSMQGFFIWVCGPLMEKRVQSEMVTLLGIQSQSTG